MVLLGIALFLKSGCPTTRLVQDARVGKDGKLFYSIKSAPWIRGWIAMRKPTDPNDRRISGRLGRFLRRTSLDEFPSSGTCPGRNELVGPGPRCFIVAATRFRQRRRWWLNRDYGLWQIMGEGSALHANSNTISTTSKPIIFSTLHSAEDPFGRVAGQGSY